MDFEPILHCLYYLVNIIANAPKALEALSKPCKIVSSHGHTLYQGV